jgi:hypothetical protein
MNAKKHCKNIPTLPRKFTTIFEGMYQAIVNDSIEPVTAQDGIQANANHRSRHPKESRKSNRLISERIV